MKKFVLPAVLYALLTASPSHAEEAAYARIEDIPRALRDTVDMNEGTGEPQYVSKVIELVGLMTGADNPVTEEDIEWAERVTEHEARNAALQHVLIYDSNFDMKVTRAELEQEPETITRARKKKRAKEDASPGRDDAARATKLLSEYDLDGDGVIAALEVSKASANKTSQDRRQQSAALARAMLKENGDSRALPVEKMAEIARKVFRTVDADKDKVLSKSEAALLSVTKRRDSLAENGCVTEPAVKEQIFVALSTVRGGAISDVALGGQDSATGAIAVDVQPGDKPIYLFLHSEERVIWRITGEARRVARAVVTGPLLTDPHNTQDMPQNKQDQPNVVLAAVTGLPEEKVFFLAGKNGASCPQIEMSGSATLMADGMRAEYERRIRDPGKALSDLSLVSGRPPDEVLHTPAPVSITISDKGAAEESGTPATGSDERLDPDVWKIGVKFNPGGVAELKDQKLFTHAAYEPYRLLPGWAGLAQLTRNGSLELQKEKSAGTWIIMENGRSTFVMRATDGAAIVNGSKARITIYDDVLFRIAKEISVFPAGLEGVKGARFVLGKGIRLAPDSLPGSSCLIDEETGEQLESRTARCPNLD